MRYFSSCFLCVPALFAATTGQGAIPYEGDLPIELARYFAGDGVWYADLPDDFPPFTLPANLQVLGSLDQGRSTQVILTTTLEPDAAQEALAEAFLAEGGWMKGPSLPADAFKPRGFVEEGRTATSATLQPIQLCHDSLGMMQIDERFRTDVVYIRFGAPRGAGPGCSQRWETEQQMMASATNNVVFQNMPVLELPAGSLNPGNRRLITEEPIPDDESETALRFSADDQSPRSLNRSFTRQMRRQGWKRDEQWSGELSAGSSWSRQVDGNRTLSAFINILHVAENDYELSLRLQALE